MNPAGIRYCRAQRSTANTPPEWFQWISTADLVYHNYQCHRDKYQSRTKNSQCFFFSPNCSSSKATLAVINRLWNNQFLTHQMRSQCHFYQDIWSLPASPMLTHPPQIAVFQGQYILKKEHWLSRDQKESPKPHIGLILWLTVEGRKCRRNAHIKKKNKM